MFLSEPSFFLSLPSPLLSFFSLEIILEKIFGLLPVTFFSQIERHEVCSNMICHWRKTGCQKDDDMMRTKSRRVKERVSERMWARKEDRKRKTACVRECVWERVCEGRPQQKRRNVKAICFWDASDVTIYKVFRNQFSKHLSSENFDSIFFRKRLDRRDLSIDRSLWHSPTTLFQTFWEFASTRTRTPTWACLNGKQLKICISFMPGQNQTGINRLRVGSITKISLFDETNISLTDALAEAIPLLYVVIYRTSLFLQYHSTYNVCDTTEWNFLRKAIQNWWPSEIHWTLSHISASQDYDISYFVISIVNDILTLSIVCPYLCPLFVGLSECLSCSCVTVSLLKYLSLHLSFSLLLPSTAAT